MSVVEFKYLLVRSYTTRLDEFHNSLLSYGERRFSYCPESNIDVVSYVFYELDCVAELSLINSKGVTFGEAQCKSTLENVAGHSRLEVNECVTLEVGVTICASCLATIHRMPEYLCLVSKEYLPLETRDMLKVFNKLMFKLGTTSIWTPKVFG